MKGIIYVRVSSDEQVKGTSLENQDELCRAYCETKGIDVLEIFREEGASAKTAKRAQFLRAIEYCRKHKGQVDAFVVYKVDRFARNTEDHFYVRKTLIEYGVSLHSVSEPIGNNPAEKFIETVLAGSAEFDNAVRTQRSVEGMAMRIQQGIYPFKPPLGYDCQQAKSHGYKKNTPDQPNAEIFPIIQKGLKEFAKGFYSQVEMLAYFDRQGLSRIRGKRTTPQMVSRIFDRYLKFYAGILVNPWTKEDHVGLHQPMITKEEYLRIRAILAGKSNKVKRVRLNPQFPLRQTVKCGYCGAPLTGSCSRGRGGKYHYYHCFNKKCSMYGKVISKTVLEKEFIEYLEQITPKRDFLDLFEESVLNTWNESGMKLKTSAQKYETQLSSLKETRQRIFEMREDGSYTTEEFQERKEEIENKILAIKISLNETRIDQLDIEGVLAFATKFISNLGRQWFDLSISHARFQKMVFPDGISYRRNEGFGTPRLGLIYELNRTCGVDKSHVVHLTFIGWNQLTEELRAWQGLMESFSWHKQAKLYCV